MRRFRVIIVLLLIMATTAGCAKIEVPKKPIRIAFCQYAGYAHAFIAQEKGFFKQNGVEVELVFRKEYSEASELYRSGQADGIFEVFSDAVFHNSEGIPTKVVYVMDYSDEADVIVAGLEINSLLDLKEQPVGIDAINSFSHLFVLSVLINSGLKEEDLHFEIVPALEVPKAIDDGRIVAGHTWEPAKSEALKKGYKALAKAGDLPALLADVLAFKSSVLEKRPDEVRAIIKALFQALDFVQKNRIEAVAIMAKAEGMTPGEIDSGLKGIVQFGKEQNKVVMHKKDDKPNCNDPGCLLTIGKTIYDFYGKRGRYFNEEDLYEIIDPSFLE